VAEERHKHDSNLRQDQLLSQQAEQLKREISSLNLSFDREKEKYDLRVKEKIQLEEKLTSLKATATREELALADVKQQVTPIKSICVCTKFVCLFLTGDCAILSMKAEHLQIEKRDAQRALSSREDVKRELQELVELKALMVEEVLEGQKKVRCRYVRPSSHLPYSLLKTKLLLSARIIE